MSIKCTSRVWDHSTASSTFLLILLAIADHAHEDGTGAYPSTQTLASKCRISKRSVQRCLKNLVESGELKIEYGKGRNGTNMYTILTGLSSTTEVPTIRKICFMCSCEEDKDNILDAHHRVPDDDSTLVDLCRSCHTRLHQLIYTDVGGDNLSPLVGGGDILGDGGDTGGISGVTPTSPKPSVNRQEPSVKRDSQHTPDIDTIKKDKAHWEIKKEWDAFLLAWAHSFPNKVQPRYSNSSLKDKLMRRLKSKYFRENYRSALMEVSSSDFINSSNWMQADWFLKNDANWEKCLDGKYRNNDKPKHSVQQATKNGLVKYLKDEGVIVD